MDILEKQLKMHKTRWDLIEQVDPQLYKKIAIHTEELSEQDWTGMMEVEEDVYHSGAGISRSMLMDMRRNPNYFHYRNVRTFESESTDAMDFGDMVHKAILEPHLLNEKYMSDQDLIAEVMEEKDYKSPRATKIYKEKKAELELTGKTVMAYEKWEEMKIMVDQIWNHPVAKNLLNAGMPEKTIYAQDPVTGLLCRVRSDYMLNDGVLIDVKTTKRADEEDFSGSITNQGYHVQAAYYCAVAKWAFGAHFENFVFICLEKEAPFDVAIYKLDCGSLDLGEVIFRKQLDRMKECIDSGKFPSYPSQIQEIGVRHWAFQKEV